MSQGRLFLIMGPSGVGKGTLIGKLREKHASEWVFPLSATTRPPRPGEVDGVTYHYFSNDQFEEMIKNGELLEHAFIHQQYYYGVLKKPVLKSLKEGATIVREVDVQGFHSIRREIPSENLTAIFLLPPDLDTLKKRILGRAPMSDEELSHRMESAQKELAIAPEANYRLISEEGRIDELVTKAEEIISSKTQNS